MYIPRMRIVTVVEVVGEPYAAGGHQVKPLSVTHMAAISTLDQCNPAYRLPCFQRWAYAADALEELCPGAADRAHWTPTGAHKSYLARGGSAANPQRQIRPNNDPASAQDALCRIVRCRTESGQPGPGPGHSWRNGTSLEGFRWWPTRRRRRRTTKRV